jgi:hypothetical protein
MTTEFLNRTALVVRPKQPYIDWADSFDDGGPKYDPDHHQAKVFLIDEVADTRDIKKVVRRCWQAIFEEELNSWMRDPDVWPHRQTLKVFLEWFEVEVCDVVLDLGKGPIDYD